VRPDEVFPGGGLASLGRWRHAVAAQDIANGLVGDNLPQIGQRSDNAIITPAGVLSRQANDETLQLGIDPRPPDGGPLFGTVKLLSDQLAVPSQDSIRLGDRGDSLERFAAQTLADFRERGPLSIIEPEARGEMRLQNPVLRSEVFVPKHQLLIDEAGDVGPERSPLRAQRPQGRCRMPWRTPPCHENIIR
jgi:hypothetical protein